MLEIRLVIEHAERIARNVERELPGHQGLLRTAQRTVDAAREAERLAGRLKRPIGLHRLPAAFLVLTTGLLLFWGYWHFVHVSTIRIALSEQDAIMLSHSVDKRVHFVRLITPGSRENLDLLQSRKADLAFVQGGVPIPVDMLRVELPTREFILCFLREGIETPDRIETLLTSNLGQGSHSLARQFTRFWGIDQTVRYVYEWRDFVNNPAYKLAKNIDAVFVVKDVLDESLMATLSRLRKNGFRMISVDIGLQAIGLPCLSIVQFPPGYLDPVNLIPAKAVTTYAVTTYLVARPDLTSRQLSAARRLVDPSTNTIETESPISSLTNASEFLQGIEAFLGILVSLGLAFLALLSIDILSYRRRFHELNSLISLVSMHQSSKDVLSSDRATRIHEILYLRYCSDVLGLISAITGYYAQENMSLLYNKLLEIIPQRCDGMKINIQLKILRGLIYPSSPSESDSAK